MYIVEMYEHDEEWNDNIPISKKVPYEELGKLIYKWINECKNSNEISISVK